MSGDWQAGDLALCIKQGRWRFCDGQFTSGPRAGMICTVIHAGPNPEGDYLLWFEGWGQNLYEDGFIPSRFRKIRPHAPDAEDRETIKLLNGVPVGEPA